MIAILGAGRLAEAIVRGLDGPWRARIVCTARRPERAAALRALGVEVEDNVAAVARATTVVVAVRHDQIGGLADEIAPHAAGRSLVSLAAGVPFVALRARFPGARLARVVTSVAAATRSAISAIAFDDDARHDEARALFAEVGELVEVREALLDACNALVGVGPATIAAFTAALRRGGEGLGLDAALAERLARAATIGAATRLARASTDELIAEIAGPGGASEAALRALATGGLDALAGGALDAAVARSRARSLESLLEAFTDLDGRKSLDLRDGTHYEGQILEVEEDRLIFALGGPMAPEAPVEIPLAAIDLDTLFHYDRGWKRFAP